MVWVSVVYRQSFAEEQPQDWTTDPVWYVSQSGRLIGPMSTLQLALAARECLLDQGAFIWRHGLPRWFGVTEVTGLLANAPEAPPPPVAHSSPATSHATSLRDEFEPLRSKLSLRLAEALAPPEPQIGLSTLATFQAAMARRRSPEGARTAPDTAAPASNVSTAGDGGAMPDAARSVTQRIARNLADHVIRILERNEIKTFDDLASNERLDGLAARTFESLPGTLRLALSQSVGRPFVEARVVDLLIYVRTAIPRHARDADLRALAESQIPVLAAYIEQAVAGATSSVGSYVTTRWSALLSAFRTEAAPLPLIAAERPALGYHPSP